MSESADRRSNLGWCMYDWANSAYTTTVAVGLLPVYFAEAVVGPEGVRLGDTLYRATTLWGFTAGLAAFLAFLLSPTLGAVADMTASKKRFLLVCAFTGSLFTVLLYSSQSGDVFKTPLLLPDRPNLPMSAATCSMTPSCLRSPRTAMPWTGFRARDTPTATWEAASSSLSPWDWWRAIAGSA